jgi:hypothetical protein
MDAHTITEHRNRGGVAFNPIVAPRRFIAARNRATHFKEPL